jgi:Trk-type K+ transport systems, membrane components
MGQLLRVAVFYLTFVGGCSGSTAGGLKIFRFQVAGALLMGSLKQLIHPRAVIQKKYNNRSPWAWRSSAWTGPRH